MVKQAKFFNLLFSVCSLVFLSMCAIIKPNWLIFGSMFTWVFGYFLVLLIFTPAGSITFGDPDDKIPYFIWLGKIVKANVVLLLFTLAAIYAYLLAGPAFSLGPISLDKAKAVMSPYFLTHWGIFPWGVYGGWAFLVAYNAYIKKGVPYLYQCANYFPVRFQMIFKTFVETACYVNTISALGIMAAAIVLLFAYAIYLNLNIHHFYVPLIAMMVLSMFISIFITRFGQKFFKPFGRRRLGINRVIIVFLILMLPLLLIIALCNYFAVSTSAEIYEKSKLVDLGKVFDKVPVEQRITLLFWSWFIIWTPLAGSYLAVISKGRTLREFALGVLFIPIVFAVSYYVISDSSAQLLLTMLLNKQLAPIMYLIVGTLSAWALLKITRRKFDNKLLISGFFPVSAELKRDRIRVNHASKVVGITKFASALMVIMIMFVIMHVMGGWYMLQFHLASIAILVISVLYFAFDYNLIQQFLDKLWIGNQNISSFKNAPVMKRKRKR